MIRELMGIDRVAREKVEATKQRREQQETEIAAAKASLGDSFAEKREREIAEITATVNDDRAAKLAAIEAEHAAALNALDAKFAANRAKWADELFERAIKC
jgi:hypothetical protein